MQNGYTDLAPGKVATVVTYLEMRTPAPFQPVPQRRSSRSAVSCSPIWNGTASSIVRSATLAVVQPRAACPTTNSAPFSTIPRSISLHYPTREWTKACLEFDRRRFPDIELSFFGVTPALIGKGAGRALLQHCLPLAWEHYPQRVWLHTCTSDHPAALGFYMKFGFVPYKRAIEIADDPRVTGDIPRTAAPHMPII